MFNSFLYGNGLTLATLYELKNIGSGSKFDRYLDFNVFMKEFIEAKDHKRIKRGFNNLFDSHLKEYKDNRNAVIKNIKKEYKKISEYGFERWISKGLFVDQSSIGAGEKLYSYLIYNYWYSIIVDEILNRKKAKQFIENYSKQFLEIIKNENNIYTTNFDMIHDNVFDPEHIHGRFSYPFKNAKDVMYKSLNSKEFEYNFLLGTNGFEKINRINNVKKYSDKPFDDEFFYSESIELGHLLIYGLAFGKNESLTDDFLSIYPKHKSNNLATTVDGHIIIRLEALYKMNKIEQITIAYYSKKDLENYKSLFKNSSLNRIIKFKKSHKLTS